MGGRDERYIRTPMYLCYAIYLGCVDVKCDPAFFDIQLYPPLTLLFSPPLSLPFRTLQNTSNPLPQPHRLRLSRLPATADVESQTTDDPETTDDLEHEPSLPLQVFVELQETERIVRVHGFITRAVPLEGVCRCQVFVGWMLGRTSPG